MPRPYCSDCRMRSAVQKNHDMTIGCTACCWWRRDTVAGTLRACLAMRRARSNTGFTALRSVGLGGLREGARPGRPGSLSEDQAQAAQAALRRRPADFGLSGNLWDGKTLAAYLEQEHGVSLSARQCRRFFRQREFRLRKPRPLIARADPERQMTHKKTPKSGA